MTTTTTLVLARQKHAGTPPKGATACLGNDYDACGTHASSRHVHGGRARGLTARAVLSAFFILQASLPVLSTAQERVDNRRLFWTGSAGATWDNSVASWMTTGSYLTYAHSGTDARFGPSATWAATTALPATPFLAGDVAIFDRASDIGLVWSGSSWMGPEPGSDTIRTITIADGGVTASDVIVNTTGLIGNATGDTYTHHYVFTGGAITATPDAVAPGSTQLSGTGVGLAAGSVSPAGRLIKFGAGSLTLSNTAANHFAGGIHLLEGTLSITDNRALGDNCIVTSYVTNAGGIEGIYGNFVGEKLLKLIQQPGVPSGGNVLPAIVQDTGGRLFTNGNVGNVTLHIAPEAAGIDITGDIYIGGRIVTFNIEGDTTISGRVVGTANSYGANAGTLIKEGQGTLTLTGTRNWFYGSNKNYNQINTGRVVATSPYAIGSGAWSVNGAAVLEFRGVHGTVHQAFIGGGNIEVTAGSDLTFDWRNGTLDGFDDMSGNGSWHPAKNELSTITVSGQSRFSAIASGTYSSVLGGAGAFVSITEGSTLVLGREGLSARGSVDIAIPMTYAILANRVELTGGSTLVLNPNAYLSTGALVFTDTTTTCSITFGASGVSRLRVQESNIDPDTITAVPAADAAVRYIVPDGMKLIVNDIPVPVSPAESTPPDNSSSGWCREYILVNQGANPLKDIVMTLNALDALHDTLSSRLADELLDPVIRHAPARKRKWVNEAWARYIVSDIDYDATSITTPGITGRVNGLVVGLDWLLPARVLLGFHGTAAENSLDTTNGTSLSSKQKTIGLHAAQRFGKFYLAASADTGRASTDSFRYEIGNLTRGKWDTSYYSGDVRIGATFSPWEKTILKPYAGLRYSKLKLSGHFERGLSPLVIDDFDDASAQAVYGLSAGKKFKLWQRDFAADLSLARKHTIRTPRETLNTHYYDAPGTLVTLERGDYYSDRTAVGLSLRAAWTRHTLLGLAFDYETSSSYDRLTGSLMAGFTW
jgi:autotransporter-associated beta strand protein